MKKCCKCKEEKDISAFHKDSSRTDGLYPKCKACVNAKNTEFRQERMKREIILTDFKVCSKCQQEKAATEFPICKSKIDFLNSQCKSCLSERNAKKSKKIKLILFDIKQKKSCKNCGNTDPRCLDFHHKDPKQKNFCIGQSTTREMSKIMDEINQCEVLCANCHRILHYEERN